MEHPEKQYLDLMRHLAQHGDIREGRNGKVYSDFGHRLVFDMSQGDFPLLTTKRVFWKGIIEELLWFLRGSTDAQELQQVGVRIWDGNSSREYLDKVGLTNVPEHHIGAGYGFQLRHSGGSYPSGEGGVDQLRYALQELSLNPAGRRALIVYWNPKQLCEMALPPCHYSYQFYVSNGNHLHCQMVMRSCDTAVGLPYNIASTALFVHVIAWALGLYAGRVIICTGDTHLYDVHMEGVQEQLGREPKPFPKIRILKDPPKISSSLDEKIKAIEELTAADFELEGYESHPAIKYVMVP